ncbi:YfjI family protein [Paracoccaceae bacterium]|nr:YfjI family protein [Paracoccaceae bacterium]
MDQKTGAPLPAGVENSQDQWPAPDMSILEPEQLPPPQLSEDKFNTIFGSWADWIKHAAHAKGSPAPYVTSGLMTSFASCIGNKFVVRVHSGWEEPIALWIINVGEPSSNKSPGLDAAIDGFTPLKQAAVKYHKEELADWNAASDVAKSHLKKWNIDAAKDPSIAKPKEAIQTPKPHQKRHVLQDITIEKVADILSKQSASPLLNRDELAGWLSNMGRYSNGSDREFWLEAYGGRPYTVERKSQDNPLNIDRLLASLCGNIQPEKLKEVLLKSADDGLTARMIFLFPEPVKPSITSPNYDLSLIEAALKRLDDLKPHIDPHSEKFKPKLLTLSIAAEETFNSYRLRHHEAAKGLSGSLASHTGKYPGLCLRLAAVFTFADWAISSAAEEPTKISDSAIQRAIMFIDHVIYPHAERIYLASDPIADSATKIAKWILDDAKMEITAREIYRAKLAGLKRQDETTKPIQLLIEAGWLNRDRGSKGSVRYHVNPAVHAIGSQ